MAYSSRKIIKRRLSHAHRCVCVCERGGEEEGERDGEEEVRRNKILNQMAEMMLALFPHTWRSWTKFYFKPLFCVGHTL